MDDTIHTQAKNIPSIPNIIAAGMYLNSASWPTCVPGRPRLPPRPSSYCARTLTCTCKGSSVACKVFDVGKPGQVRVQALCDYKLGLGRESSSLPCPTVSIGTLTASTGVVVEHISLSHSIWNSHCRGSKPQPAAQGPTHYECNLGLYRICTHRGDQTSRNWSQTSSLECWHPPCSHCCSPRDTYVVTVKLIPAQKDSAYRGDSVQEAHVAAWHPQGHSEQPFIWAWLGAQCTP